MQSDYAILTADLRDLSSVQAALDKAGVNQEYVYGSVSAVLVCWKRQLMCHVNLSACQHCLSPNACWYTSKQQRQTIY